MSHTPRIESSATTHAVIYVRVSSDRQVTNASLETQERDCRAMCEQFGWKVLRVFREEGESAKTANRTQLNNALEFCRQNKVRPAYFVVWAVDRFARCGLDHDKLRLTLLNWDIRLRAVKQQLGETSMDKFIERIWSGQAELENDARKERTIAGMGTRLGQGTWTHKAPLGYINAKRGPLKILIPDPDRSAFIREAFERYATGLYKREEVLEWINDKGLRTRDGKRVSTETFRRALINPLYIGKIIVQGKKGGAGLEWQVNTKGNFPPIISEETFQRVQELLGGRRPTIAPRRRNHPDFPLRGFVLCGSCERAFTGSKSTNHAGVKYAYYHCQNPKCAVRVNVSKQQLENDFISFLRQLRPNSDYLRLFHESVLIAYQQKFQDAQTMRDSLERELRQMKDRKRKLHEAFLFQKSLSEPDYRELKEGLEQDILATEMKINDARQDEAEIDQLMDFVDNLLRDAAKIWNHCELAGKQRLQQVLFPQGVYYVDGVYRTNATSLMFSLLQANIPDKTHLVALPGIEPGF